MNQHERRAVERVVRGPGVGRLPPPPVLARARPDGLVVGASVRVVRGVLPRSFRLRLPAERAPALEALPPDSEAKSILHRARALGDDLTRMTETQSAQEQTTISPRKLISEAVRLLLGDDPDPTNPIHVDIDPDIETIDVDAGSFRQALLCLLRNAKKVSPEGDPIQIRVRRNSSTFITLEVIDQGTGMNATTMPDSCS